LLASQSTYHSALAAMHSTGPRAGNSLPTAIAGLLATAYNDTIRIVVVIAIAGAILGLALRPTSMPRAVAPSQAPAEREPTPMLEAIAG
jgi:hypothetical protein